MAGRGSFNTKLGFVFAAVGSAVGLGNLWRFPYLASTNGGATFLALYLVLLFLIGLPALMAELSLGRGSSRNAVDAFGEDGRRKRWEPAGYIAVFAALLLVSYYSVIAGWSLRFLFDGMIAFNTPPEYLDTSKVDFARKYFDSISQGPPAIIAHLVFMALVMIILMGGVAKGIELANLIMMPVLFATVIGLVIYANTLDGSAAGRAFYLQPSLDEVRGSTISNAAGQTFFSIGLGVGTMLTYSSYLNKDSDLQSTGLTIGFADTAVAVLAGLMVFPLIFSLGLSGLVDQAGGSTVGGLFIAIPTAFAQLGDGLGTILSVGFFVMLSFAALSSAISLLEVGVSFLVDRRPTWGRPRAVLALGIPVYTVGLLSAISLDFLTYADALVSRILLITGGLLIALYVGWIRPHLLDDARVGVKGVDLMVFFRPTIRYVLPVLLSVLLVLGVLGFLVDIGVLSPAEGSFLAELTT